MNTEIHFHHISLSSSKNDKYFGKKLWRKSKHSLCPIIVFFSKIVPFMRYVEKLSRVGQSTYDNMARACYILYTQGCKDTLRICNTYCFSTAIMVARTRLNVTLWPSYILVIILNTLFYCKYSDTSANEDNSFRNHMC